MKIALVGDIMLGRLVNQFLKGKDPLYPWGNTLPLLKEADIRIGNLECVLSDIGKPWSKTPKVFHFRSDENNSESLTKAGIDIVSLANNHVLDYEERALLRMLDLLDENKIQHSGAGKDWQKAVQPAILEVKGQKMGMIAFTDNEPGWEAEINKPGIFYCPIDPKDRRAQELFKQVSKLKTQVNYVIVSAHWGPNWGYEIPREQPLFAHTLIDSGADLIFGHSGHIFRGIEIYKDKPIIYCAGDFIDDYAVDEIERNDESFLFILNQEGNTFSLSLYPTIIQQFQNNLATFSRQKAIISKMQQLCEDLGTPFKVLKDCAIIRPLHMF